MESEKVDFRMLLSLALRYWYLYVIILPLVAIGAYFYLRTQPPVYESNALLLIMDDESSNQITEASLLKELGAGGSQNLENEQFIIASTPVMFDVVKELDLQYQYSEINTFLDRDLYPNSPIRIADWKPKIENASFNGEVILDGKGGYQIIFEEITEDGDTEERMLTGEFGKPLLLPKGKLTLTYSDAQSAGGPFRVRINSQWSKAMQLKQKLLVEPVGEESSVLSITYRDVSPQRTRDVIEKLIEKYNQRGVDMENQVFKNTINLINERIELINQELTEAEKDVEDYKQSFGMTELSAEGSLLLTEMTEYNDKVKQSEVQLSILESIENYLVSNKDSFDFVPTNVSLSNPTLTSQLESFNRLLADKEYKTNNLGPAHPDLLLVEKQIKNLRATIIENIESMKADLMIARNANRDLQSDLESRLRSLPRRERELIEIERRKSVKENLYVYLLQKREESAISMAITKAKGEVVEPPEKPYKPISPKPLQIWIVAGFLGLALPSGIIYLLTHLNNKIQSEEELEQVTELPVAGVLAKSGKKYGLVIDEKSRTVSAEMFRMLRANLAFIAPDKVLKSLLVTSSMPGEGKSFITLNLGMVQAMSGKKVIILEMDLRKPQRNPLFKSNGRIENKGIVNYLVDDSVTIHEVIHRSGLHDNLDYISCGMKPPNPSELILSSRLRTMIDELREVYDFIILDSPPVGIFADALQLKDIIDATLFVVRADYTPRTHVRIFNDIAEKGKLPRPFLVLNGISLNKYGYAYGKYGSGYKYAYVKSNDYFEEET